MQKVCWWLVLSLLACICLAADNLPKLQVSTTAVEFTLGDDQVAVVWLANNDADILPWSVSLPSNVDETSFLNSESSGHGITGNSLLLPDYSMPWLEVRKDKEWLVVENKSEKDKSDSIVSGELEVEGVQKLEFRIADPENDYESWLTLDRTVYNPYQYTKFLHVNDLVNDSVTKLAVTLYIPELRVSPSEIVLSPENTQQWVQVENIGAGELRWRMQPELTSEDGNIYAIGVAQQGENDAGQFLGEGSILFSVDTPLPRKSTQQIFQISYMGGDPIPVLVKFEP